MFIMRKILYASLMVCMAVLSSQAATRGDVKVIEASENIRFLTQKIIKNYLHLYNNPKKSSIKYDMDETLIKLNNNFIDIAITTKDSDSKDMLDYLLYSKGEIENIVREKANHDNALLMLDYSEVLLEGVDSIENAHMYDFSDEERMLIATEKMIYLLERIMKHYMAYKMGLNMKINEEQMLTAMSNFEENLESINHYEYPNQMETMKIIINKSWVANKVLFSKKQNMFIPNLLNDTIVYLEETISKLSLYHSKNQ